MKKMSMFAGIVLLAASVPAGATTVWQNLVFDSIGVGGISYNAEGNNVVVAGSAFNNAIAVNSYLGTQKIGGDGIDNPVTGSLALYGEVSFSSDPEGVLAWAAANPTTPFALEVRLRNVTFNTTNLGPYTDNFVLDAQDIPGVPYLMTTFAELWAWGYVELAPGVWMDIAVAPGNPGYAALAVVIEGYHRAGFPSFDGTVVPGALEGPTPGHYVGSGIRIAPIPEPMTMAGVFMGVAGLAGYIRKRRMA